MPHGMRRALLGIGASAATALLALPGASTVSAGPFADFEQALAAAYAPYRAALIHTNQKDRAATEKSLAAFEAAWGKLMLGYRAAPPPQYADDPAWADTTAAVERIVVEATAQTAQGDLAKAHDVLEGVREQLGELRARNGVIVFSDRMNAYHEHLEEMLASRYATPEGAGALREDAAVLRHLSALLERHAPAALRTNSEFMDGLAALVSSAKALQDAARGGDTVAVEKALKGLKPAYARLFAKFG